MENSDERGRQCPECGQTIRPEVNICRHCGYVFPVGKAAERGPRGLTRELAEKSVAKSRASTWVRLALPVLGAVAVVGLVIVAVRALRAPTWESAQRDLPAARWYDSEFEDFVIEAYRRDGVAAEAHACDGTCLVNVAQDVPRGLLNRLGTKLGALAIGCTYAELRKRHGDDPVATVVIFTNGRRYAGATCDGQRHPELLR